MNSKVNSINERASENARRYNYMIATQHITRGSIIEIVYKIINATKHLFAFYEDLDVLTGVIKITDISRFIEPNIEPLKNFDGLYRYDRIERIINRTDLKQMLEEREKNVLKVIAEAKADEVTWFKINFRHPVFGEMDKEIDVHIEKIYKEKADDTNS